MIGKKRTRTEAEEWFSFKHKILKNLSDMFDEYHKNKIQRISDTTEVTAFQTILSEEESEI